MDKISFDWNLILECNYRCPYCWFNGKWQELKSKSPPSIGELIKYWDNIYKRYGSVHINVLGGEPFLYPGFVELIKELSNTHIIGITTNLSCDIDEFLRGVNPLKVGILSTFHPAFAEFDSFLKKALLLKEYNFGNSIAYLAYPPQIRQINYYKEKFDKEGVSLFVMTFWGKYKGVDYPGGYIDEEKKIIEPYIGDRCGERFQIVPKKVKGLLCNAGHKHAAINVDGRVTRCGGADSHEITSNFFDENFRLLDEPQPCNSEHCPCNEWAFLLVEEPKATIKKPYISRRSIPPYCVFFSWYLNNECNYKCSFCKPQDIKTVFVDINKWIEVWDGIYDRYESCHIHISGGEPFIYPNFIELITRLSKKHTLEFSTNLSIDIGPFIENISPQKARLGGSFHPEFADFEDFLEKILLLKERGYEVWVNYVAYPPHLKDMGKYKRLVEETGVRFSIQPFNGKFEGREYPQNYTEDEKRFMVDSDKVNIETIDWRTDENKSSIKGRLCRMGQMYARIYPDAEVYRCCGNGALRLGNLLDGTFSLLEEPMPCECDNCPCWKCMLVDREDYWPTYWTIPGRTNLKGHEKNA